MIVKKITLLQKKITLITFLFSFFIIFKKEIDLSHTFFFKHFFFKIIFQRNLFFLQIFVRKSLAKFLFEIFLKTFFFHTFFFILFRNFLTFQ